MHRPFFKELMPQARLEEQYERLVERGVFTQKEIAIHLARFTEAHIYNAAEHRIIELEEWMSR